MGLFLLAAAALGSLGSPFDTATPPSDNPALWIVADADTKIYLFGTFHALDGKSNWFSDEIETAFSGSDELVLETVIPKLPALAPATALRPIAPIAPVAGSASFLSSTKVVMSAGRSKGMSTRHGADTILHDTAEAMGKRVGGLETFDFQLGMFSKMPPAPKSSGPAQDAATKQALSTVLTALQAAWNRGEAESFTPMLEQMRAKSPDMYQMMFVDRNARWASWIAKRLEQPGTVFVAVGAGHLAGRDSLQSKLATLGLGTARLN